MSEKRPRPPKNTAHARARDTSVRYVPAAAFKTTCLELLNRVRETGVDFVVTKHGTPVARVVPYRAAEGEGAFFGSMKGSVLRYDRPFAHIDGDYDINTP